MKYRVTTLNSVYIIDNESLKWAREGATETSGNLRTESGTLKNPVIPTVGKALTFFPAENLNPRAAGRAIITTTVTKVETIE